MQFPFVLRDDFVALLFLPEKLTTAEAERLCRFLRAIAVPQDDSHNAPKETAE
jgi:hypothetical protein